MRDAGDVWHGVLLEKAAQVTQVPAKLKVFVEERLRCVGAVKRRSYGHGAPEGALAEFVVPAAHCRAKEGNVLSKRATAPSNRRGIHISRDGSQ